MTAMQLAFSKSGLQLKPCNSCSTEFILAVRISVEFISISNLYKKGSINGNELLAKVRVKQMKYLGVKVAFVIMLNKKI